MIKTFADKETQQLFITGKSKRLPPDLIKRAVRRLEYVNYAIALKDSGHHQATDYMHLKKSEKGNIQYLLTNNGESVSNS